MTLFRRVLAEKRVAFAAVGVVVLADVLLYGLAVQPARSGVERTRQRAAQAARDVAARTVDVQAAQARLAGARRAGEQLERFHAEVLPADLARARDLTYPRLADLASRFGLGLERRTSEHDRDAAARLDRMRTTLRMAGRYGDLRRFIEAVEAGPDFLIIDAIALSRRAAEPGGELVLTLGVATYFPGREGA